MDRRQASSLRILHCDRKDRINDAEPVPPADEIVPPVWLSEKGRAIWDWLAPSMITRTILTAWDVDAFGVLCEVLARNARGYCPGERLRVADSRRGGLVPNLALKVQADSERTFLTFAARLG
ncbi:P27 family phage terminase small subunit [Amycolatopsis sp. MJM2582]|uniref:P27 family phage terminase small subunit n=1 Tax=Amycolatopsis sp. MJM2582 TaxID=1427749 RepID=UPI001F3E08D4|nr:P27 family phage terminase small subunit [Amycolatopsis sp. MJM2582]